eukprot:3736361-Rhodomonas_salina.1
MGRENLKDKEKREEDGGGEKEGVASKYVCSSCLTKATAKEEGERERSSEARGKSEEGERKGQGAGEEGSERERERGEDGEEGRERERGLGQEEVERGRQRERQPARERVDADSPSGEGHAARARDDDGCEGCGDEGRRGVGRVDGDQGLASTIGGADLGVAGLGSGLGEDEEERADE